jgi:hypothetical protein
MRPVERDSPLFLSLSEAPLVCGAFFCLLRLSQHGLQAGFREFYPVTELHWAC